MSITEKEVTRRIDQIVETNLWEADKDRGLSRMVIDVFRDPQLIAALEDADQIRCDIDWNDTYGRMALILHYESRIIEPSASIPRDYALRQMLENQARIAQELVNAFVCSINGTMIEALGRYDAKTKQLLEEYGDE